MPMRRVSFVRCSPHRVGANPLSRRLGSRHSSTPPLRRGRGKRGGFYWCCSPRCFRVVFVFPFITILFVARRCATTGAGFGPDCVQLLDKIGDMLVVGPHHPDYSEAGRDATGAVLGQGPDIIEAVAIPQEQFLDKVMVITTGFMVQTVQTVWKCRSCRSSSTSSTSPVVARGKSTWTW